MKKLNPTIRDLAIVLTIAIAAIVLRSGEIPLQGEETRRGEFAVEMLRSGDLVNMTQQGLPFIDRPPAQYWVIAASFAVAGGVEPGVNAGVGRWSLRAPSLLATILTALLVWGFARRHFGELAGLTAGIAYPTMAMVLDIGRQAETEAQFVLLLSGAVLVWLDMYLRGRPSWQHFLLGYALCAFAALTKGTQAPVAFVGMLVLVLATRKDWRALFSWGHLAGLSAFVWIVALWQVSSFRQTGAEGFWNTWFLEAAGRTGGGTAFFQHLLSFPFEFLSQMLPWGLVLILFAVPSFWRSFDDRARSDVKILILAAIPIVVPVWLVASARIRYVMPAVPIAAILIGIAVAQSASVTAPMLVKVLKWSTRALAVGMVVGVIFSVIVALLANTHSRDWMQEIVIPPWIAVLQAVVGIATATVVWQTAVQNGTAARRRSVIGGGIFIATVSLCTVTGVQLNRIRDVEALVRQERPVVPGEQLVSLGTVHHQFVFNWPRSIPVVPNEKPDANAQWHYFVFNRPDDENDPSKMPQFKWREVTRIELNRNVRLGDTGVIIGERLE